MFRNNGKIIEERGSLGKPDGNRQAKPLLVSGN
jgi:hypothetical protein